MLNSILTHFKKLYFVSIDENIEIAVLPSCTCLKYKKFTMHAKKFELKILMQKYCKLSSESSSSVHPHGELHRRRTDFASCKFAAEAFPKLCLQFCSGFKIFP